MANRTVQKTRRDFVYLGSKILLLSCPSHNVLPRPGTTHLCPLYGGDEVFGGGGSKAHQVGGSRGGGPLFAVHHSHS